MNQVRIAERVATLRPTAVNVVLQEAKLLQASGKRIVSLMRGQPDTPTPEHIIVAAEKALRAGRTGYADNQGEPNLRTAIAAKLARSGLHYDPAREILVTDGATLGIATALATLLQPGADVMLPDPIYDAYTSPIALWGGKTIRVRSKIRDGRFSIDRQALEASLTPNARLLLLNTPWNPVGTVLTRVELQEVLAFASAHDLFIISDEIYESLIYDGRQHLSPAGLSEEARKRTLLVNSLSKTYAMTGWRVGYVAGPAEIIAAILLVLQQSSRGPATFVQDAAAAALQADPDPRMAAEYQARRDLVLDRLKGIDGVQCLVAEGGLFVMVDIRGLGRTSDEVRKFLLHEAGVMVIHGSAYGPGGEGTLRVSFAGGGETLANGLDLLRQGLERLAHETRRKEVG